MLIRIHIYKDNLKIVSHLSRLAGRRRENLCKKVAGKKFLKKNLEIKTLEKKSEFSKVLGKNVTENKVQCFGFLGLFS